MLRVLWMIEFRFRFLGEFSIDFSLNWFRFHRICSKSRICIFVFIPLIVSSYTRSSGSNNIYERVWIITYNTLRAYNVRVQFPVAFLLSSQLVQHSWENPRWILLNVLFVIAALIIRIPTQNAAERTSAWMEHLLRWAIFIHQPQHSA